jgi:lipopolysaccharide heptosyltransferase II
MHAISKILIIRFSSLGDIVLTSPLIRALRTTFPAARIDFLLKSRYVDLVNFNPHLSAVVTLETSGAEELRTLRRRIRNERYDLVLDLQNSPRSRYIRMFSGAHAVRSVDKRIFSRFCLVNLKKNFYRGIIPVPERYLETARDFGVKDDGDGLEVFVPEDTVSTVRAAMSRCRLERYEQVVGLAPSARHATKRWPADRFIEAGIRCAKEFRAKILLFGGKEDREFCGDCAQLINAGAGGSVAENFAGVLSLLETPEALGYCTLVISNDTGMMHLAASRKRKIVAIFGPTVGEFGFLPFRTDSIVFEQQGLSCRPCSHIGRETCPEGHFRCMKDTTVDQVMAAAKTLCEGGMKENR